MNRGRLDLKCTILVPHDFLLLRYYEIPNVNLPAVPDPLYDLTLFVGGSTHEHGPPSPAAALEVRTHGHQAHDGFPGGGGLQPRPHAVLAAPLGPPALQGPRAPIPAGTGVSQREFA